MKKDTHTISIMVIFQGLLNCVSINNATFIDTYFHYDTVSFVLGCIIPIYAATLAYFALIPKFDLEKLKSILLQLQQSDSGLLQIKKLYDDYEKEYKKIENIDKVITYAQNFHVFSLRFLIVAAMFFLLSANIIYPVQIISLITIILLAHHAEFCIEQTCVKISDDYPSPPDLLDASKTLTSIKNIDVNLYENLPAYILARGTSITVKNDFLDLSFIKLENKEKYSNFILIDFALPFNLKNFSLEYTSKNYSLESISLSDKKLLFDRKNPSLEILITKDNELNEYPYLQLSTKRSDEQQEVWPFTPKYPNTSEYIARYPIINIRKLGKTDMSRYIIH